MDKGIFEFALIVGVPNIERYSTITLPDTNHWGVIMRKEAPLSEHEFITLELLIQHSLKIQACLFNILCFPEEIVLYVGLGC